MALKRFITSQGSEYIFDSAKQTTVRNKRSGGSGQGEEHNEMQVVFLEDKIRLYSPTVKVSLGVYNKSGSFTEVVKVPSAISEDDKLVVVEMDRLNPGRVLHIQRAHLEPAIGLRPFEQGYDDIGQFTKHLGNEIVEIEEAF